MRQSSQGESNPQGLMRRQYNAQQQTLPQPTNFSPAQGPIFPTNALPTIQQSMPLAASTPTQKPASKRRSVSRFVAALLVIGLAGAIYFIWHTTSPTATTAVTNTGVSQQNFSAASTSGPTTDGIRVYVVGAVKNPGIYTLASGARVYDLLQAAGGALPKANLVAINLAAKLSDGHEVYIRAFQF